MSASPLHVKSTFMESTNIGNILLAMGKLTQAQLVVGQRAYEEAVASGRCLRIGDVLKEMGFVTEDDLLAAQARQNRARNTKPANHTETFDALKVLKQTANAYRRTTEINLQALDEALKK